MTSDLKRNLLKRIFYFFPFQLVFVHIKSNFGLLLSWIIITGIVNGTFFSSFGAHNLFLNPEYLGQVNWLSHFILGFSIGGFIMAFNIASYILNGIRFPIIATLNRPFSKFCLNNFIIPLSFLIYFLYKLINYQQTLEFASTVELIKNISGFILGVFLFVFLTLSYFLSTNKSFTSLFGNTTLEKKNKARPIGDLFTRKEPWYGFLARKQGGNIETYLLHPFKIALARDIKHYDRKMLETVFAQNHVNATIFELAIIASIVFFGIYSETPVFKLPAAASIMLLITMILMLVSAIHSWLRSWSTFVFIAALLLYNFLSQKPEYSFKSYAFGLKYSGEPAPYSNDIVKAFSRDSAQIRDDIQNHKTILENWKRKNIEFQQGKPKLVFINCSGGGLRASAWVTRVIQHLDSVSNGTFLQRTHLITGSSGGMIGAAFIRDLYFRSQQDSTISIQNQEYYYQITKDLLNSIAISFSLTDWLPRIRSFEQHGETYTKDRGYAFERQLSENTEYILDQTIGDYKLPEQEADIPLMILSPTITNDARQLLISSQPISFLTQTNFLDNLNNIGLIQSVDYHQLLKNHNPDSLSLLSALRMNATFFYVLPNIGLPTKPTLEVMDSGIRDNYGTLHTIRYITQFIDWINENTSGVVIVQIRDRYKTVDIEEHPARSLAQSILRPLQVVSETYLTVQNYNQDDVLMQMSGLLKDKISVVNFHLKRTKSDDISLSWHLTEKEKEKIQSSINEPDNQLSTKLLMRLLKIEEPSQEIK